MYYTIDSAKQAYNEYLSLTGRKSNSYRKKLKENGVFGVSIDNPDERMILLSKGQAGQEKYIKIGGLKGNNLAALFPKKDGGFIGIKNPSMGKTAENLKLTLEDVTMFDENLNPVLADTEEQSKSVEAAKQPQVPENASAKTESHSTGFETDYADPDLEKVSLDRQRYEKEQVNDFNAKQREKEQKEWKAKDRANNRWAEDNGIYTPKHSEHTISLYKQFMDHYNKDGTQKIGAIAERDYAGHFNKDLSVTNKRKEQLLSRRWKKTLEEVTPDASRETYKQEKMAMEKFSKDYNLDIDLSDYKTSAMGRIANRIRGNKNISKDEALQRMHDAYMSKTDEYLKSLKEQHEAGKLSDKQYLRRANVGYTKRAAAIERGETKASKLGWKGKAGAAAALLALGGVIGNQFSGGHQSNAQLYNPNPQPQYAN